MPIASLLALFEVAEDRAAAFLERLKQLRHLGVPSGLAQGTRPGRSLEQMVELALAIHLIDAGLSSAHIARLMRTEWPLASAALRVFQWTEVRDASGDALDKAEAYWLAEPAGLSEYRQSSNPSLPRLATIVLFEGERLQDKIDDWPGLSGWPVTVVGARRPTQNLMAKYLKLRVVSENDLQAALSDYAITTVVRARELLPGWEYVPALR